MKKKGKNEVILPPTTSGTLAYPGSEDYADALNVQPGRRALKADHPTLTKINQGTIATWHPDYLHWANGAFAYVYRCETPNGVFALRCLRSAPPADLADRYMAYSRYFLSNPSPYIVDSDFIPEAVFVATQWFPAFTMAWVEGETLTEAVDRLARKEDKAELKRLADGFDRMMADLRRLGVAHGDLHPDNVMVDAKTGQIRLVDYDTLFVPELAGRSCNILGCQGYVHPGYFQAGAARRPYDARMDEFGALVISLSLRALAHEPFLHRTFTQENLLLPSDALENPEKAQEFEVLDKLSDAKVRDLAQKLREECRKPVEQAPIPPPAPQAVAVQPAAVQPAPAVVPTGPKVMPEIVIPSSAPPRPSLPRPGEQTIETPSSVEPRRLRKPGEVNFSN